MKRWVIYWYYLYSRSHQIVHCLLLIGRTIAIDRGDAFPFFKDKIERSRIKIGQSNYQDKQKYFEQHQQIEASCYGWNQKLDKIAQKLAFNYQKLKVKLSKPPLEEI